MKQEERTELTRERILKAAIQEYGTNGYSGSTLNAICSNNGIAKGLLYHNFDGKDDLYLGCVARCIDKVTEYLKTEDIRDNLEKYTRARFRFFAEHPHHARIFFEAILQPPAPLADKIRELRKDFDSFNREIYRAALSKVKLREGITETDAIEYYEIMQEMFNGYFSSSAYASVDFQSLVADHEKRLSKMLNIILYGIGERGTEK